MGVYDYLLQGEQWLQQTIGSQLKPNPIGIRSVQGVVSAVNLPQVLSQVVPTAKGTAGPDAVTFQSAGADAKGNPLYQYNVKGKGMNWDAFAAALGGMGKAVMGRHQDSWQAQLGSLAEGWATANIQKKAKDAQAAKRDAYLKSLIERLRMGTSAPELEAKVEDLNRYIIGE